MALEAGRKLGPYKILALILSGHGHFDLAAYDAYSKNELEDYEYPEAAVKKALTELPKVPAM